jgi:hypothetical protein
MVTLRKPPLPRMTLCEFLQWEPADLTVRSWQLIDREPVAPLLIGIPFPSNEVDTRTNVWTYASIPASEILVVHSTRIAAELLRREPNGQWPDERASLGPDNGVTLASIAFTAPLRSFCRTTVLAIP